MAAIGLHLICEKKRNRCKLIFQSRYARLSQRETEQGLLFCCYYCCCHFSKQGKGEKLKIAFPVDLRRETIGRTGWTFFFVFCCFCLSCFYLCCAVLNKKETRKKCKFSFPTEMIKGRRRKGGRRNFLACCWFFVVAVVVVVSGSAPADKKDKNKFPFSVEMIKGERWGDRAREVSSYFFIIVFVLL